VIRAAGARDCDAIWRIFHAVVHASDTYTLEPDMPRDAALAYWLQPPHHCFVAERDGEVVGTYIVRPNQHGNGAHVANAAFMVAPHARGLGVGRAMGEHALAEAQRLGFRAMQFNFVVSTNEPALCLWRDLGFRIVGTLPGAFRHPAQGYVDAYVMFREIPSIA